MPETSAIYPGSFDPITNGHVDIIERGLKVFDRVVVAVLENPKKRPLFTTKERVRMIQDIFASKKDVEVRAFDGLLVDFARAQGTRVVIRGLRAISDFEYEFQMALMNRSLAPDIETFFMMPSVNYSFLSSNLVREVAAPRRLRRGPRSRAGRPEAPEQVPQVAKGPKFHKGRQTCSDSLEKKAWSGWTSAPTPSRPSSSAPGRRAADEAYELVKIGYEPLPHDAIVEGTIIDSAAVVETIRLLFEENKISTKDVAISISGNSVIIKKISLPVMEKQELAESIIWEAKHNIPYPYEETNVDYAILKPSRSTDEKNLDILLVAAKKDKIANYSNVINQARKNLQSIEVDVFALQNVLEVSYPEIFADKTLALINIGANITNVVIVERGTPQLFRDLSLGGFFFTENIRKELSISFEEAEKLLKGIPGKSTTPDQFATLLSMNVRDLLDEIEKTFSFYEASEKRERKIEQIVLSGGLANVQNMVSAFETKFRIKTEILNPFRNIRVDDKKFDAVYFTDMAPIFGVAVGLATRKVEK